MMEESLVQGPESHAMDRTHDYKLLLKPEHRTRHMFRSPRAAFSNCDRIHGGSSKLSRRPRGMLLDRTYAGLQHQQWYALINSILECKTSVEKRMLGFNTSNGVV